MDSSWLANNRKILFERNDAKISITELELIGFIVALLPIQTNALMAGITGFSFASKKLQVSLHIKVISVQKCHCIF